MTTLTVTHPMAQTPPLSAEAVRVLVLWVSIAVMIVIPAALSVVVLARG